ncbi:MAG: DUF2764 family protein [Candidatus Cryptobacteroides sp.]|nr:DUF2764 family protein [Bacteroidales bacterium]
MNNYEYIIASLPDITLDWKESGDMPADSLVSWIKDSCSSRDRELIDFLQKGFDSGSLDGEFYSNALSHRNPFIREYFRFDLNVRNAKVNYLNKALGRAAGTDIFLQDGREFEEAARTETVLASGDILSRERGLDDLMWDKIDELTTFDYFDIEAILGFIAKLQIVMRWRNLDPDTGRKMFGRLVNEVRGSYTGVRDAANAAVE